jgi:hypothetical protein
MQGQARVGMRGWKGQGRWIGRVWVWRGAGGSGAVRMAVRNARQQSAQNWHPCFALLRAPGRGGARRHAGGQRRRRYQPRAAHPRHFPLVRSAPMIPFHFARAGMRSAHGPLGAFFWGQMGVWDVRAGLKRCRAKPLRSGAGPEFGPGGDC